MKDGPNLTALEASFLDIELPGVPMHVAGLVMLDGRPAVTLEELREMMSRRIRRLPKFTMVVDRGLLGLRSRHWRRTRIDLDAHLFHHRLRPPGSNRELFALCGRIHETLMPRDQPLWEMHLIDGLSGGGQALLVKTHHSITDGLAGIEIAEVLFDPANGSPRPVLPPTRFGSAKAPSPIAAVQGLLGLGFYAAGGPVAMPGPFSGPVGPHRVFAAASLPMDVVRRTKRRLGGSIDDILVAAVTAGLRKYLVDAGYPEMPDTLRAMLPVSTRQPNVGSNLGNAVTAIFVDLPMNTDDLAELVSVIASRKATLRVAHAPAGMSLLVEAVGLVPAPLHGTLMQVVSTLPLAHVVVSDIPGPEVPLRLLGRPITACYPLMPLTRNMGLSVAAVSMCGVVGVGVTADPGLVPKPQRVVNSIVRAFGPYRRARDAQRRAA